MRFAVGATLLALTFGCGGGRASQHGPQNAAPTTQSAGDRPSPAAAPPTCRDEPGMVYIPGGHHRQRNRDRKWREVDVAPFWLDRYEVTVAEYRRCVTAGACPMPYAATSGYSDIDLSPLVCTWEMEDGAKLPINCVDTSHENAYCAWAEKRTVVAYEWTWAMQGREWRRKYPWGDEPGSCELAIVDVNMDDDVRGCGRGRPWPTGSRPKDVTRDGVYDMAGNVGEGARVAFPEDFAANEYGAVEGCGAAWTLRPYSDGLGHCAMSSVTAYSDNAGFRCAKDPGPSPPCTVAD